MRARTSVAWVALCLVACGETAVAPTQGPAPSAPAPSAPVVLTAEERAHRDAELADWMAVDALVGECYAPMAATRPFLVGRVSVHFFVHPDGRAHDVTVTAGALSDDAAEACILRAMEARPFTASPTTVERTIDRSFDDA